MPSPPRTSVASRLARLGALLAEVRDVVEERVHGPEAPAWAERRGWTEALLGLDDATLERAEHGEIARVVAETPALPPSLRELAERVRADAALPRHAAALDPRPLVRASDRKRRQVAALAALARSSAPSARRVVDLGAGHGHLTRELAEALDLPAVGVELRPHVVATARALTRSEQVTFVARDALAAPVEPRAGDLLVGLHACGALGDALVRAAAESGAGVLLLSCCPQKIAGEVREPLSTLGRELGLALARPTLGLANLATLAEGGVDSRGVTERRRVRRALWLLLREAGAEVRPGDEVSGIHRRQLRRPLAELAERAFALRGLPAPSARAIEDASRRAVREQARARRLALPRAMLGRPLELALVLDRAACLAEHGGEPEVLEAFDRAASPRNVAIVRPARDGAPRAGA